MKAKIYKPTKNAMQSGQGRTKKWLLEYEPEAKKQLDPLMGWTSSPDTRQQLRLYFDTEQEAVAYATSKNIAFEVVKPAIRTPQIKTYADNFSFHKIRAFSLPKPETN